MLVDMALWIVIAIVLAGGWLLLGRPAMDETAKWLSAAVGAASVAALAWSGFNAVRSRLLLANPANAQATLRTKDPMARLRERYEFLVRSANGPIIVVVDNLDRCDAKYVVDLLEGIHTLLKPHHGTPADANFVAFVVPADRAWLCDSFTQRYSGFKDAISEPGRPFGLSFVDKVFDVMLCLPRIAPACARMPEKVPDEVLDAISSTPEEMEIRRIVHDAEQQFASTPVSSLRIEAVVQIGKTEAADECDHACSDTKRMLAELSDTVDVGPVLMNQLRDAYCVHRTAQFLGGHEIDCEDGALMRLGRWTVLDFRWPLLTAYLREHPDAIEDLQQGIAPDKVDTELRPLFTRGDPPEIAQGLTAEAVRRFTRPLSVREPALSG
jgi:hypothetical protein